MTDPDRFAAFDWDIAAGDLDARGHALLRGVLSPEECDQLIAGYGEEGAFRKTVPMARYRFGEGEYRYWDYPLPSLVESLRNGLYPYLVPIVNSWFDKLGIDPKMPACLAELKAHCHANGQTKPTPLILRYGPGGYNTLHQDLYGEVFFPLQAVITLNRPGTDFEGGEFVMTEQLPRAQSKASVLSPGLGDMVVFTTNFRPVKSARGYYRARMRHGVSALHSGQRHAVGIIFHDAQS
ncbi:2OG-Fe(II) oxygenase [Fulvimarina sp. MAC3]|uniref:2OG-Fe(II) oxygenase n=1 Tax=Fulvimarina sp. MAC3 TaxID=3148887 RepID=UPI0031FE3F83